MQYWPGSYKVRGISMILKIKGKEYAIFTNTHGAYIEVPESLVSKDQLSLETEGGLFFKVGDVNFDNYK